MKSGSSASSSLGQRILAAIVFTDCVGFSARMSADEEQTLQLIKRDAKTMKDLCQQFEGQVLKSTGDGLLMCFASALQAVKWAIHFQQMITENAKTLPPQEVLHHRIGIHLGDVFFDEVDVMGNGVNIAARLEGKAATDGICLSQTVYDVIKDRLEVEAVPLGPLELKNIPEPIQCYQLLGAVQPPAGLTPQIQSRVKDQQQYRDRQILISKVRTFWIKGVLETSLHGRAMIELGLQEYRDAISHPWGISWRTLNTCEQPLPEHSSAIDLFDQLGAGRTLLILGEPGSGKTTTLLQLTQALLQRAEEDVDLSVPVVFNLSSWMQHQSLAEWLLVELGTKYQVPRKIGKDWVEQQQMLLMLDGLDEVSLERREDCVQAINRFKQDYYQTEVVVCSRIQDYEALSNQLKFQGAILIQPLNPEQVDHYLAFAGEGLLGLREVLPTDSQLQELVKTPLMLSVMSIAYQGMSATDLIRFSLVGNYIQPLFDTYIQRMLARRPNQRYSPNQTQRWLAYLAKQLTQESQTVFLIEQMQPKWLISAWFKWFYGSITGLVINSMLAPLIFPLSAFISHAYLVEEQRSSLMRVYLLMIPLILIVGCFGGGLYQSIRQKVSEPIIGLIFVISNCLASVLFLIISHAERMIPPGGPLLILIFEGFIGWLFWNILKKPIIPVGPFKWSWLRAREKAISGALWGFIVGTLLGILYSLLELGKLGFSYLPENITILLILCALNCPPLGIIFQLLGVFIGGLTGGITDQSIKTTTYPNQGILQIIPNVIGLTIVGAVVGAVLCQLIDLPLIIGIWIGSYLGLLNGWDGLIKHFVLRYSLWRNNVIPWNYAQFLNYATSSVLLQRVGGGYVFIHRMLLEHFAQM